MQKKNDFTNRFWSLTSSKNWFLMLLSIIAAFACWLLIIDYENPVVKTTFYDIKIDYVGADELDGHNLYAETEFDATVDVTIEGKRNTVIAQKAEDIIAEVDVKTLIYGANSLPIKFTAKNKGIEIVTTNKETLNIDVDHIVVKDFMIDVFANGEIKNPYYIFSASTTPPSVTIRAPEKKLAEIARVFVLYDIEDKTQSFHQLSEINIVNAKGEFIDGLDLYHSQADIDVKIGLVKTVNIIPKIAEFNDKNFRLDDFGLGINSVKIKGIVEDVKYLNNIRTKSILIPKEQGEQLINVSLELPKQIELAQATKIGARAIVDHIEEKYVDINADNVIFENDSDDIKVELASEENKIELRGLASNFAKLKSDDIFLIIDLADLTAGEYDLPFEFYSAKDFELIEGQTIKLKLE